MASRWWIRSILALLLVSGCTNYSDTSAPPTTYRVRGKVLQASGEPVHSGTIRFHAKDKPGNDAMAAIEKDGTFKLGTFAKDDGAIPGRYAVTIDPKKDSQARIPRKFWDEATTSLSAEVKAEKNVLPPFHLR